MIPAVAADDDHYPAAAAAMAPQPVGIVPRDGVGQAEVGAIEIDGTGLAVVLGKDASV